MTQSTQHGWLTGDPFQSGDLVHDQLGLMYPVMRGVLFPDMVGPIVLQRRQVYPGGLGDWHFAGHAHPDATSIVNGDGITHGVTTGWEYSAARINGGGFIGPWTEPTRVDIDAGGDIISPSLPTWPRDLRVEPAPGGTFTVAWLYDPFGQGGPPTDFAVYDGADTDNISYVAAIGTTTYLPARSIFTYTTGVYADDAGRAFAVRARNSGGVAERNEYTTGNVVARDATPAAGEILSAKVRP